MNLGSLALTATAAIVGATLATLLHLPAAPLLGAMVGVAVVNISTSSAFAIAPAGRWIVYVCMGWLLGLSVTTDALKQLRSAFVPTVVTVVHAHHRASPAVVMFAPGASGSRWRTRRRT